MLMTSVCSYAALETKTMMVDGYERTYLVYTPSSYNDTTDYPVLMLLHPIGFSATDFAEVSSPQTISDVNNAIIVLPEALDEQNDEIVKIFSMLSEYNKLPNGFNINKVWSSGARIQYSKIEQMAGNAAMLLPFLMPKAKAAGYAQLNENIDDVKFLNEVINELQSSYHANTDIFVAGVSLGGSMTYKYAFSPNSKAKKIGVVHGFVSAATDTTQQINIPLCVFHSQADKVVEYNGGLLTGPISDDVHSYATKIGCDSIYTEELMPNIKDDGISVTYRKYTNPDDSTQFVWYYIADNAAHQEILNGNDNDIDYVTILEEFFFFTPTIRDMDDVIETPNTRWIVYPNPTKDYLYCTMKGEYEITDMTGRVQMKGEIPENGCVNLTDIPSQTYIFVLKNGQIVKKERIVKK